MRKIISTAGLSREDWLRTRKLGIGGSDAGAVVSLDLYKSAMTVYHIAHPQGILLVSE